MTTNETLVRLLPWKQETNGTSLLYEQIANLINTIYYLLLIPVATIGNLLTIIVVVYIVRHQRRKRNVPDLCLGVLAIVDLCSVILVHPVTLGALYMTEWLYPSWVCLYQGFAASVYLKIEFMIQVLIALDRHFALVTPLRYRSFNSTNTFKITVMSALTFCVGTTALSFWLSSEPVSFIRTWQFCTPAASFHNVADIILNTIVSAVFIIGIVLFVMCNITLVTILRHYHKQRANTLLRQISDTMQVMQREHAGNRRNGAIGKNRPPRRNQAQEIRQNQPGPVIEAGLSGNAADDTHARSAAKFIHDRSSLENGLSRDEEVAAPYGSATHQSILTGRVCNPSSEETNQVNAVVNQSALGGRPQIEDVGHSARSVRTSIEHHQQATTGKQSLEHANNDIDQRTSPRYDENISGEELELLPLNDVTRSTLVGQLSNDHGHDCTGKALRKSRSFADTLSYRKSMANRLERVELLKSRTRSQITVGDSGMEMEICTSGEKTAAKGNTSNDLPRCQTNPSKCQIFNFTCSQETLVASKPISDSVTLPKTVVQPGHCQLQAATVCSTLPDAKPCTRVHLTKPDTALHPAKPDLLQVPAFFPNSPPVSPPIISVPNSEKFSMSRSNISWDPVRARYVQQQMAKFLKKMEKKAQKQKKELLLAKMVLFCATFFVVTWVPHIVVTILSFCYVTVPVLVSDVALKLVFLNAFLNPVFYGLCRKTYRQGFSYLIQTALYFICCGSVHKPGEDKVFFDSRRKKVKRHLEAAMFVAQRPIKLTNHQPALNRSAHALHLLQRTLSLRPVSPGICQDEFKPSKQLEELYERYMMESDSGSSDDTSPIDYEALLFSDGELYHTLQKVWSAYLISDNVDCYDISLVDDGRGYDEKADSDIDLDVDYDALVADNDNAILQIDDAKQTDNTNEDNIFAENVH